MTVAVASDPTVSLKISAAYGRLYISGPNRMLASHVAGATNNQRGTIEVSLTLESLRTLRKHAGVSRRRFAQFCTPDVLKWARAAGISERIVNELHQKLGSGWRLEFPWDDTTGKGRKPFAHQEVMATVAYTLDGCAFVAEMGTAKTRPAIEALRKKFEDRQIDVAVVVCPRGVIGTWERESRMWAKPLHPVPLIDMSVKDRIKVIDTHTPQNQRERHVYIINYDVLHQMQDVIATLARRYRVALILDELHRIKNPKAKMSAAAMSLAQHVSWRLGLTGSPILQGVQDIWSQWYFVDLGITFGANFVQFRREWLDESDYNFDVKPKAGALEAIGLRMRRRGLRYTKAECLDLPPKTYETIDVEMTKEQQGAYNEMRKLLIARLNGEADEDDIIPNTPDFDPETGEMIKAKPERVATAANELAMILRLTQITSGFVPDSDGVLHFFQPNPKLETLAELVAENIGQQQIIIWARYRPDHDMIVKRLAEFNPTLIRGGVKQAARDDIEVGFEQGRYRLIVGQPGAGGSGLNLQAGSLAIYYSQDYNLEHRIQSEDRCHRAGSERHSKVTYIDLCAKGSIDHAVKAALLAKKDVAAAVTDLKKVLGIYGQKAA